MPNTAAAASLCRESSSAGEPRLFPTNIAKPCSDVGQHPIFVISVAAVVAPLLAQTREGSRVPVVVIEVLLGVLSGPHVLRLTEFESLMSACTPRTIRHAISRKVRHSVGKSGPARLKTANSGRPSGDPKFKGTAQTFVNTRAYAKRKDQPK